MGKYRKKPVVIEAKEFTLESSQHVAIWCGGQFNANPKPSDPTDVAYEILIPTLEGIMTARIGDWIIKGVKGEFYPCKPDIFEVTYEPCDGE
jgi:hypothetical protein